MSACSSWRSPGGRTRSSTPAPGASGSSSTCPSRGAETEVLTLPDGRALAYELSADPGGKPVLFHHGTGDSRLARHPDDSIAASLGISLVTVDRPGIGRSTRCKNRTLLDWAQDAGALAAALGLERFSVAGWSGGGPHALAVAHALGERVTRVVLASPPAPFDQPGTDELIASGDFRLLWRLRRVRPVASLLVRYFARRGHAEVGRELERLAELSPADRPVLFDPDLRPMFEANTREGLRQGGRGVEDDLWAFLDWGFRPEDVEQEVRLFHGERDGTLDARMSERLARRLPRAELQWWDGGHFALFSHWREFLRAAVE